jgi:8-oxo-dGTP pyrophosphatase MutT (NUDIX family)
VPVRWISIAAVTTGRDPVVDLLAGYPPIGIAEEADVGEIVRLAGTVPDLWSQDLPLHLTASALVVHVASGRLLLRWHARQQAWLQVGGHGEPGEREPLQVALREGVEETGLVDLRPWPDAALLHTVIVPVGRAVALGGHRHADLRFVLGTDQPEAARAERPDAPLRWVSLEDALNLTAEANLRESIGRLQQLMAGRPSP